MNEKIPQASIPPFGLRMQPELHARLKAVAEKNVRSMNAEIVARLEESLGPTNPNAEVGPARERVKRAMDELRDAMSELELAEMLEISETLI